MSAMMAISKIKTQVPDCVMSDLNVEQMDGLEFCKELRTINPQTLAQQITDIIINKAENGSSNGAAAPIIVAF